MRAFDAVIFDFDGVIADSEPLHCHCFREVARENQIEISEAEYFTHLIGYDDPGAWRKIFSMHDRPIDDRQIAMLMQRKTSAIHQLIARGEFSALPGVKEFIQQLKRFEIPLAIYSGARRIELEPILDGLQLREHFSIITTAEDVQVGKPDPSGYILTIARLSEKIGQPLRRDRCLIIEDAPVVADRARAQNFKVLGVTSSAPPDAWPSEISCVPSLEREHLIAARILEKT